MIYIGIVILIFGLFLFLYIQSKQQKIKSRFIQLDEELKFLLNQENYIISKDGNFFLQDANSINSFIQKIKLNQNEWNILFNQKYIINSNRYTDTSPRDSRDRYINFFIQDIESLIKRLEINNNEKEYLNKFLRLFNNEGMFMPVNLRDFTKIDTPYKTSLVLDLDQKLIELSKKSNYLTESEKGVEITNLSIFTKNKEELLKNINSWLELTNNIRNVNESSNSRDYLFNRKFFGEDLLRSLEEMIRKESNPDNSINQMYIKSFLTRLSSDGFNSASLQIILNKCKEYY